MSRGRKAVKAVVIVILFSVGGKLIGFVREMLIASKFGSGVQTDTFFIALTAITLVNLMITQSIKTTMIPILAEIEAREGKEGKISHTNTMVNMIIMITLIFTALGWIFSPVFMRVLAFGFTGEQFDFAVLLLRIGLPSIIFSGVAGVLRGYLQSESRFAESAATFIPYSVVYIIYLLFLSGTYGIVGLMVTNLLAVVSQILIQVPGMLKVGYRYSLTLDLKDEYVKKMLRLVPPVLLSISISDLNKVVDKSIASTLIEGSVSALNYASRLKNIALSIFIAAISTVIYPALSKEANSEDRTVFKKLFAYGIHSILLITIPAMVGLMVLADPIVRLAFQRGAFDAVATEMTRGALFYYSLGLAAIGINGFLKLAYYSLQDTRTPLINSAIAVSINIVLNLILSRFMGHRGIALATSISANISVAMLLYRYKRKMGDLGMSRTVATLLKCTAASAFMGATVHFVFAGLEIFYSFKSFYELIVLILSVAVGMGVYVLLLFLLRVEEIRWLQKIIRNQIRQYHHR